MLASCFLILYTTFVNESKLSILGEELWEILRVLLISAAIVIPIRYFIVQPFVVRGASMEPNFADREYLVVDEVSYYFRDPARGEAIVFRYPRNPKEFFIKRISGLPGEKVAIRQGFVMIFNKQYPQGFTLQEPYLQPPGARTHPEFEITLGRDEYFVLGDNRDFSSDSRIWGALPGELIVGRAVFRAWPVARFGIVPDYSPGY